MATPTPKQDRTDTIGKSSSQFPMEHVFAPAPTDVGGALLFWLREPDGIARWQGLWDGWEPANKEERDAALGPESSARQELLHTLSMITGEVDQRIALALWCIRTRAAWSLLNLQTGYEANAGFWNLPAIHGLSALSALLGAIEPLLPPPFLEMMQDMWTQATMQAMTTDSRATPVAPVDPEPAEPEESPDVEDRVGQLRQLLDERDQERSLLAVEIGASSAANAAEVTRQKLRRLNTRLAEQAREIAHLRTERDAIVGQSPANEPGTDLAEKNRVLAQTIHQLEERLARYQTDQQVLENGLGISDPRAIVTQVQTAQNQVQTLRENGAALQSRLDAVQVEGLALLRELNGNRLGSPSDQDTDAWLPQAKEQARILKEALRMRSVEVAKLKASWQVILQEFGVSEPGAIIERMRLIQIELRQIQCEVNALLGSPVLSTAPVVFH